MRKVPFIFLLLLGLMVDGVSAQAPVVITNPGAGGMQSNYGINTLSIDQLWYAYNIDYWTTPGVIKKRGGLLNYGNNSVALYGATGFQDYYFGNKYIVGVKSNDTIPGVGFLCHTNSNGTALDSNTIVDQFCANDSVKHNWLRVGDVLVHCDGESFPVGFVASDQVYVSLATPNRKTAYPTMLSLGLEAPGQPRVMQSDSTGSINMSGLYQYAWAYEGTPGVPSKWIHTDSQALIITNIPSLDLVSDSAVHLLRRNYEQLQNWYQVGYVPNPDTLDYVIDTYSNELAVPIVTYHFYGTDTLFNCDTCSWMIKYWYNKSINWNPDTAFAPCGLEWPDVQQLYPWWAVKRFIGVYPCDTTEFDSVLVDTSTATIWTSTGYPIPGAPINPTLGDTNVLARVSYAYYDRETGIESPLGASVPIDYASGIMADTLLGNVPELGARPQEIRWYSTVPYLADTNVWYPICQTRFNTILGIEDTFFVNWNETTLVAGLDSTDIDSTYGYHFFTGIQPPYRWNCPIPASDMTYMDGRLWAIGDPEVPWRMYYTDANSPPGWAFSRWRVATPYDFDSRYGAVIALEEAAGGDAFYVFQRNAVSLVQPGPRVSLIVGDIGPISEWAIARYQDQIYFLCGDMRIYRLYGTQVTDISDPIRNQIDSVFINRHTAFNHCRAYRLNDGIKFFNDSTSNGLNYNTDRGVWSIERYGSSYVPRGSFQFDTTEYSRFAWGDYAISVLFDDDTLPLLVESGLYSDSIGGVDSGFSGAFQFASYGTGEHFVGLQWLDLTYDSLAGTLRYVVYDHQGDSLYGADLNCDSTVTDCRQYVGAHKERFVSCRIVMDADTRVFLQTLILKYQDKGGVNVR